MPNYYKVMLGKGSQYAAQGVEGGFRSGRRPHITLTALSLLSLFPATDDKERQSAQTTGEGPYSYRKQPYL